mmetsp:Transcript_76370/g.192234  ORF Transcript_76370/g.192234 Transcript_76370/m.192234 type:complete len:97 (+) Transcript_76370:1595-1885(+)
MTKAATMVLVLAGNAPHKDPGSCSKFNPTCNSFRIVGEKSNHQCVKHSPSPKTVYHMKAAQRQRQPRHSLEESKTMLFLHSMIILSRASNLASLQP